MVKCCQSNDKKYLADDSEEDELYENVKYQMPHDLMKYQQELHNDPRTKDFYDSEKFDGASVHVMPIIKHAYYMKNQAQFDFETQESDQESAGGQRKEDVKEENNAPDVASQPSGANKGDSEKGIESGSGAISIIQ